MSCAYVNLRTGLPCRAASVYEMRGKPVCAAHYGTAAREPARFREATERWVRRQAKAETRRRAQSAQIDAFPDPGVLGSTRVS